MKMKIKVKVLTQGCMPEISENGDWIDLKASRSVKINKMNLKTSKNNNEELEDKNIKVKNKNTESNITYIPLGVAIKLPKGFEAIVASRSSTPKKLNIFIPNGIGVIDQSYCGNEDEWNYIAYPLKPTTIHKGDRICQFRIQLSQKATMWQKLKWFFSNGIKLVEVKNLKDSNRGGLGSTGIK